VDGPVRLTDGGSLVVDTAEAVAEIEQLTSVAASTAEANDVLLLCQRVQPIEAGVRAEGGL
jgi:hypothetical protein